MPKTALYLLSFILGCSSISAQKINVDSLKQITQRPGDDTVKVIAYRALTGITLNTDPRQAIAYGKAGIVIGKRLKFDKGVAGCYLNTSAAYSSAGRLDTSLMYIDTAIVWSRRVGSPARIALAYLNRADIKMQFQNLKGSLLDCDSSLYYADLANRDDTKARVFQTMGSVYFHQENYSRSAEYYQRAYAMYEQANNSRMMAIVVNNIGNVNKRVGKYKEAIGNFEQALRAAEEAGDETNRAMFYENLGNAYFDNGQLAEAEEAVVLSLRYARESLNEIQTANSLNSMANILQNTNRVGQAIASAEESFRLGTNHQLLNVKQIAAEQLAEGYFKLNNFKEAYRYQTINKALADSLARQRFEDDVAALQTSYQLKEKENQIALLTRENELYTQKQRQNRLVVTGAIVISLLLIVGVLLVLSRNRISQRMKELELRTRIASDLHDDIGSSLTSIHLLSQMIPGQIEGDRRNHLFETMTRNVKETVDKMTDIVWMIKPEEAAQGNLQQRMERFAYDICAGKEVELELSLAPIGRERLSMEQRRNIYLIFKEAVNNAIKYSETARLFASMEATRGELRMIVRDEGKGFDTEAVKGGNGIKNMKARAAELSATLTIDSKPGTGTILTLVMSL